MRILFTGGGSGGHFFPIVAVAREIKRIAEEERILDVELFYSGPAGDAREELNKEDIFFIPVATGKMRRYFSFKNITDIFKIIFGSLQAVWKIFWLMPDVLFSKGGYGSFPSVLAAWIFKIPFIIHESDSIPGVVNKFFGKYARRIGLAFPPALKFFPKDRTALVGIPVRKRLFIANKAEAKKNLEIFSDKKTILAMGGSQGAEEINIALLGVIKELTDEYELIHQTGTRNIEEVKWQASELLRSFHKERYHPFPFFNERELRDAYAAADLIISRAGATAIFEIAAAGKPSLLIPLRNSAQDHQRENAYAYRKTGATGVLEEANVKPHLLLGEIKKILEDPGLMSQMAEKAKAFSRLDSAELIAREILKLGLH